jgi:F-type H+-transporting ATPase subunit b
MSFDWTTFVFELVNFAVLAWILHRLVYRPLRDGIAKRRAELKATHDEAALALEEANEVNRAAEAERAELRHLRERTRREAEEEAEAERVRLLEAAREDADAERQRAVRTLALERSRALEEAHAVALEMSCELSGDLLARVAPEALEQIFLDELLATLRSARGEVAGRKLEEVHLSSARPVSREARRALAEALEGAGLGRPTLECHEDPGLRAGLRLRLGEVILDATLENHLEALKERASELLEEAHGERAA